MEREGEGKDVMKTYLDLTNAERLGVLESGRKWLKAHVEHVRSVLNEGETAYPPSGSDCFHPELWKSGHWRWFMIEERRLG